MAGLFLESHSRHPLPLPASGGTCEAAELWFRSTALWYPLGPSGTPLPLPARTLTNTKTGELRDDDREEEIGEFLWDQRPDAVRKGASRRFLRGARLGEDK